MTLKIIFYKKIRTKSVETKWSVYNNVKDAENNISNKRNIKISAKKD